MKTRIFRVATAVITTAFLIAAPVAAEEIDGHGHTKDHGIKISGQAHDHADDHGHEDTGHFATKEFATAKEAWAFLTTKIEEGEAMITDGRIEAFHEVGEQIGAAVHALEKNAETTTGEDKAKLVAAVKQLDKAADDLHHAAEGGDADAVFLGLKKVKGLLPLIHGLHPEGTL